MGMGRKKEVGSNGKEWWRVEGEDRTGEERRVAKGQTQKQKKTLTVVGAGACARAGAGAGACAREGEGAGACCCILWVGWVGALMCLSRKSGVPRIIRASTNFCSYKKIILLCSSSMCTAQGRTASGGAP